MAIRVLLADDQSLLRGTFRLLVQSTDDMEVVGEAGTGHEAVALARSLRPDLVLMDVRMPELDGIGATASITADPALAGVKVVILTTFETDEHVFAALHAGASGFVGKGIDPVSLLRGIRTVAAGESLLSPVATRMVISRVLTQSRAAASTASAALADLTPREREILVLVGLGLSNEEIAVRLVISAATAKTHVNRTMAKLHARDRAQLVIIAYEAGLIVPGVKGDSSPTAPPEAG